MTTLRTPPGDSASRTDDNACLDGGNRDKESKEEAEDGHTPYNTPTATGLPELANMAYRANPSEWAAWETDGEKKRAKPAKPGRPRNADLLERQRSEGSKPLVEMWKRKWKAENEDAEESGSTDMEVEEIEKRKCTTKHRRIGKSPENEKEKDEIGGIKKLIEEMGSMISKEIRTCREDINKQGKAMSVDLEALRKEMKEREEKWSKEKEEMRSEIEEIKKKLEEAQKREEEKATHAEETREKREDPEAVNRMKENEEKMLERIREIEWKTEWTLEKKEREERRTNILIRRVTVSPGTTRDSVNEIMNAIGAEVEIKETREVGGRREGEERLVVVKLGSVDQKRKIMEKKSSLGRRKERIEDDLTPAERRMRWKLGEIAEEEQNEGNKTWVAYGKIWINDKLWRWDEKNQVLRDAEGRERDVAKERLEANVEKEKTTEDGEGEPEKEKSEESDIGSSEQTAGDRRTSERGRGRGGGQRKSKIENRGVGKKTALSEAKERKKEKIERKNIEEGKKVVKDNKEIKTTESNEFCKIAFWNVSGLAKKDGEFWKSMKEWDVIVLQETWLEKKGWEKINWKLPKGYAWQAQHATRRSRKGRAMGGMAIGVRDTIEMTRKTEDEKTVRPREGMIETTIRIEKKDWKIVGIYVNGDIEDKIKEIKMYAKEKDEEVSTIIGGDFNARTGEEGGGEGKEGEGEENEKSRNSKDKKKNAEGSKLVNVLGEVGWIILNGNRKGDESGEFTFTGPQGNSVIDYIITSSLAAEKIEKMWIDDRVDSDHHPVVIELRCKTKREKRKEKQYNRTKKGNWTQEERERFRREVKWKSTQKERVEDEIEEMTGEFKRAIPMHDERGERRRGWWDEESIAKKKEVRIELRRWKRGLEGEEAYKEKKREYSKMCEEKKRKERLKFIREAEEARTEEKVWGVINRGRKKCNRINEKIKMEEWKKYFIELLGGTEREEEREDRREERLSDEEPDLSKEEISKAIQKMKDNKAAGNDEIPNEVWKYGGEEMTEWVWKVCNRIWRGEGWPETWKTGLIAPIKKKGSGEKVEEYRGITLMPTMYKIYATALAGRLEEAMERKEMIPHNQSGFRKGMGTIDNIYVLKHLINKQLEKKGGKLVAIFVDLKAAFDTVDRGTLWEAMKKRGVRNELIGRVKEIYEETKSSVRIGNEIEEEFWTTKGVRQGCPLSAYLFNILTADLEEEMRKGRRTGGIELRGEKVYTLAYADDVAAMAENEEDMVIMMRRLTSYLEKKKLVLNAEKTKIMTFKRGGGRKKKIEWKWKGKKLEEVKEFTYLGFKLQRNGGNEAHVKERVRKANIVMRQTWGIGKRKFGKDWERRIWLFERLVWTVAEYAAEIWGWEERKEMEALQERYIRWILGVDWTAPGYLVREETQRPKIRTTLLKKNYIFS